MPEISIPGAATTSELKAHIAIPPTGSAPWPGVVVLHDAVGYGDDVRDHTTRLAAAGYVAVAPDLYSNGGAMRCIRSTFRSLVSAQGPAFDDIEAVRRWLVDRNDCTGRVGVIGFCMGGGFALMCAARGFDASAPNYPYMPGDLDELLRGACPIVASYGAKDLLPNLAGGAAKLEATLEREGVAHDVKEYPDAAHSFMNRHNVGPFAVLFRVLGFGYDGPSAEDAWNRILRFFAQHLREPARVDEVERGAAGSGREGEAVVA